MIYPHLPELAISIRQPWVYAIMHLGKPIENRSWPTNVRGRICLHASLGMKAAEFDGAIDDFSEILGSPCDVFKREAYDEYIRSKGKIVATADLVDCVTRHDSPWFFGRYGFVLANVQPVTPAIRVQGKLGFFDWRKRLQEAE